MTLGAPGGGRRAATNALQAPSVTRNVGTVVRMRRE